MEERKQSEFERGVMWAMGLLEAQLRRREKKFDALQEKAGDAYVLMSGAKHLLGAVENEFNSAIISGVRDAEAGVR